MLTDVFMNLKNIMLNKNSQAQRSTRHTLLLKVQELSGEWDTGCGEHREPGGTFGAAGSVLCLDLGGGHQIAHIGKIPVTVCLRLMCFAICELLIDKTNVQKLIKMSEALFIRM